MQWTRGRFYYCIVTYFIFTWIQLNIILLMGATESHNLNAWLLTYKVEGMHISNAHNILRNNVCIQWNLFYLDIDYQIFHLPKLWLVKKIFFRVRNYFNMASSSSFSFDVDVSCKKRKRKVVSIEKLEIYRRHKMGQSYISF